MSEDVLKQLMAGLPGQYRGEDPAPEPIAPAPIAVDVPPAEPTPSPTPAPAPTRTEGEGALAELLPLPRRQEVDRKKACWEIERDQLRRFRRACMHLEVHQRDVVEQLLGAWLEAYERRAAG